MIRTSLVAVLINAIPFVLPVQAADLVRGEMLYKNHCRSCHESTVHVRNRSKAKSITDIRYWVIRWSTTLGLDWDDDTIKDVTRYVNKHYYKFQSKK